MKNFQTKSFYSYHKSATLKVILLPMLLLFCLLNLNAQEESNIKLKIETGLLMTSEDSEQLGFFLRLEPTLKTSKNTFIGLRIGVSANTQKIENHDPLQFTLHRNISTGLIQFIDVDNRVISFVPTFNYYFKERNFRPYLGLGLGYHLLTNYTEVSRRDIATSSEDLFKVSVKNKGGFLLRGGLDFGKLIVGLEFNYIQKTNIKIPNGETIGTVDNSYIGLSIGYIIQLQK